ncbi:MAG: radical SAM protein [Bacillota bacterium]|nr:radical SAM protein [Bacillota bacterium]
MKELENCRLCRRNCNVNRLMGETGYCRSGLDIKLAKASLHLWEEPPLSMGKGSGTVFFSNCNFSCVFCQNYKISQEGIGKDISIERLSEIFLNLQQKGANNINLVTPTSYVPQIIEALKISKKEGLTIPIVYNTNSYENTETIKSLRGLIDIYLPDIKYYSDKYAVKYSNAPNYFDTAKNAVFEMFNQVGDTELGPDGKMKKGVIIRHLMLPGLLFDSKKILDFVYNTFKNRVYLSLMNQYTPFYKSSDYKEIDRKISRKSYDALIDYALSIGIEKGFIQEDETQSESFIPDFDLSGI